MPTKVRPQVPYTSDFGSFLKEKRLAKDFSQADLATALGYDTAQVVSNWERGLQAPPFEKLLVLCHVLNISRKDILNKLMDEQAKVYESSMKQLWAKARSTKKTA